MPETPSEDSRDSVVAGNWDTERQLRKRVAVLQYHLELLAGEIAQLREEFDRQDRDVHLHVDLPQPFQVVATETTRRKAASMQIAIGGTMATSISIDNTGQATVQYKDDHGDTDAQAPDGTLNWTIDDTTVATVDGSGKVQPVNEGTTSLHASLVDASGNPVMEPNGTDPFQASAEILVVAGAAQTLEVQVTSS